MNRDAVNATNSSATVNSERPLVGAAWAQFERITAERNNSRTRASDDVLFPGYRILGEIHRGGQGVVYQAIQESTRRKVAIKIPRQGPFADPTELARFDREVDVLSRLNHPHIVAIHDRGLTAGHAYYVMDYIAGRPLDAYVAGAELSVEEVLALFAKVCDAVNVAHLRGVIHRDLKPGNILMDVEGQPRILDFGLAKLAQESSGSSSAQEMTLTGQFIGSLPWASPEQVGGTGEQVSSGIRGSSALPLASNHALIDIRTDVYSLGVILYQLLTGQFPYPVTGRLDDVVRHIAQTDPARPTTFQRGLEHDVELIVLKCLAKEPERRYQSAGELARDIGHYLAHEPVTATSASAAYRLRKFVRRHRGAVIAGGMVVLAMLIATGVSITFGLSEARQRKAAESARVRAEKAEGEARQRAGELEQVANFQEKQLASIDAQKMGVRLRADLLTKARAAAERSKLSADEVDARVANLEKLIAGSDFTGISLKALNENFFQPALAAINEQFSDHPQVKAQLLQSLASTLQELGLYEAASSPQAEALAIRRHVLGDDHPGTLTSMINMGYLLKAEGKIDQAEPYYREALEKSRRAHGDEHQDTLNAMNNMGSLLQARGRLDQAEPYFREVLEKRRRLLDGEHPDTLVSLNNMGDLLQAQGKLDQAETIWREALVKFRRVLGDEHPYTLRSINNMGFLLQAQGKFDQAEPYWREALEKYRHALGDEHPDTLRSIYNMGYLLQAEGKLDQAEPYYREALEKRRRVLGDEHPDTLISISNMGILLQAQRKLDQAEPYYREALEKRRRVLGNEHPHTLASISSMGDLLQAQGKSSRAIEILLPAEVAARKAFTGGNAVRLGRFLTALGRARVKESEFNAAESNLTEAHALFNEFKGATVRDREGVLSGLVELYDTWHVAEPDKGYDAKATDWRTRLQALKPTP